MESYERRKIYSVFERRRSHKNSKKIVDPMHNGRMTTILKATGFEYSTDKHKKMHKATTH